MAVPEPLPTPRGAHLQMVGAVLAGEGLERIAEIAADHVGAPVAVIVPRIGESVDRWAAYERYVSSRLAGARPDRPPGVVAEVPIASGGRELGAVLQLGPGPQNAGEYLHMAAIAALTAVAVVEARDETEQSLRGSLVEELLAGERIDEGDVLRRARRLGAHLQHGAVALCARPRNRAPGRLLAVIAAERPDALTQEVDGRIYVLLPGTTEQAAKLAARLSAQATVGVSSRYANAGDLGQALEEAQLVLDVRALGGHPDPDAFESGTYRLLFRAFASNPEEVRSFYEETIAPLHRYDEQYTTDLVRTLEAYFACDCSVSATAHSLETQPHTVGYRLDRIRELSGLDPARVEDRERLGLGLKAYRVSDPRGSISARR
ncbi:MAG: PucR family transcriptional regulator [Thermoleophilaceae bacterium]